MPKVIIDIKDNETARKLFNLLTDLQQWRCGLRSIASTIRKFMQGAKITRE